MGRHGLARTARTGADGTDRRGAGRRRVDYFPRSVFVMRRMPLVSVPVMYRGGQADSRAASRAAASVIDGVISCQLSNRKQTSDAETSGWQRRRFSEALERQRTKQLSHSVRPRCHIRGDLSYSWVTEVRCFLSSLQLGSVKRWMALSL